MIILRKKTLLDAANDYLWKKDPELCILDAVPLLTMGYTEFLAAYPLDIALGSYYAVCLDGKHIGNCGFYGISGNTAELGVIIGDKTCWGKGYGTEAVKALLELRPEFHVVRLKVLLWNKRAQKCFEKCGFTAVSIGTLGNHMFVFMEVRK